MYLSIANRILLGFALILALMMGLGFYAVQTIEQIRDRTLTIVTRDLNMQQRISTLQNSYDLSTVQRQDALQSLMAANLNKPAPDPGNAILRWRQHADALRTEFAATVDEARTRTMTAVTDLRAQGWQQILDDLLSIQELVRQLSESAQEEITAIQAGNLDRALQLETEVSALRPRLTQGFINTQQSLRNSIDIGQRRIGQINDESRMYIAIALTIAVLLSALAAFLVRSSIVTPLTAFASFVERVGRGDLAGEPARAGRDELGRLGATLNAMVAGLHNLATQNREVTDNLNAATAEIRASMQEQAASVEEQLAAVQETAATVDEITHAGGQVAKRAQEVIAAAQATAQTSNAGLQAVDETARAMDAIREQAQAVAQNIIGLSEKTQAIGEIIMTVNDISERSHLLALNAAIEAAAAGEQGRSFAVVAGEMKTLADQAKDATSQVRSILGDIQRGINSSVMLTEEAVKRVTLGKERSDVTQTVIEEITARVQESVQTFQQIVASTNQQQLGIEQVMGALQNIRQASQQTASGTRQLDTAAGNLAQLSGQLTGLSERYRL